MYCTIYPCSKANLGSCFRANYNSKSVDKMSEYIYSVCVIDHLFSCSDKNGGAKNDLATFRK